MDDLGRLAIVNRGEAAMRALHAIAEYDAEHGTTTTSIALATAPDRRAWFVREADEVVDLGPAMVATEGGGRSHTYLDVDLLERVLLAHAVDSVWVGWGFVAESAAFAAMCERNGITFIGPSAEVIRRLGDKVEAKRLAEEADVPVVPWSGGPVEDEAAAREAAAALGLPVLVKAAAGGGGRGIRRVDDLHDVGPAFTAAVSEARHAFGDPTVFVEKVVTAARHVEVQVIADRHGSVWAVGTRDCTVQRRNQKVLEESASTALDEEQDRALRSAAAAICTAAGYHGAGTVEFLWDPDRAAFSFMEVNTRLQVEHPVTELTTGLDLVKLQLHVARGGRLEGDPPPARGHAVEARLNAEDPARGFAPAPGRVSHLRLPTGPGVRVDTGIVEGDEIAPDFDSMVAKVIAWGADRPEAIARLRRALAETITVIEDGTTNKSFLLHLLDRPAFRDGDVHTRWLDELTAAGRHLPAHHGACLVAAGIEAYDVEHAAARASFLASAARGRPEVRDEIGHAVELRFRGEAYRLRVHRTGPSTYRVDLGNDTVVDAELLRLSRYERRLRIGATSMRVVADVQGPTYQVEVDGVPHRMERDDGGFVRSPAPAVVISLLVEPGDEVAVGTPVAVLESMKMESTIVAPFAGRVRELLVAPHDQVHANAPLLQVAAAGRRDADVGSHRIDLDVRGAVPSTSTDTSATTVRSFLLGYDLDPVSLAAVRRDGVTHTGSAVDRLAAESELLTVFADLGVLARRQPRDETGEDVLEATSPREHLITYLRAIDRGGSVVPSGFADRLRRALAHYGVTSLDRTPALDASLHLLYRALDRLDVGAELVAGILDGWIDGGVPTEVDAAHVRTLTNRLVAAAEHRHPVVADLARTVRFEVVEQPVLDAARDEAYEGATALLDELESTTDEDRRAALVAELVAVPLPLRAMLLPRYLDGGPQARTDALVVRMRRYYRIRDLARPVAVEEVDGCRFARSGYDLDGRAVEVAMAYTSADDWDRTLAVAAGLAAELRPEQEFVLDVAVQSDEPLPTVDELSAAVARRLQEAGFPRPPHRVDTTATFTGAGPVASRTLHVTHRGSADGRFDEDLVYRNLHPMLGKRIGLWRLRNFALERLESAEDVYLFRGTAHENAEDVRLFAIAEVRDLTPLLDDGEVVGLPLLERQLRESTSAIRRHLSHLPARERPVNNRIILDVRPPLTVGSHLWRRLADRLAPSTAGLGLERVVVRADVPDGDGVLEDSLLHIEYVASHGVVVRREPAGREPIRPLTPYRQRVLRTERRGSVYPYELVRLLTPAEDAEAAFPPGSFVEHDLDDDGRLVPVDRPHGQNRANLVVGVISNRTATVPEGMRRVIVLGDPSRSLGSLAEPECRRINAALDLAEAEGLPLEWFAVSSGARISTESGTENMDWIGAVLRRLIEFTQAGGEVNVVVTGINVGAQPYWNAEATMLMHTSGILVMTPASAMVLTGKQALDFSGGVSAEDNLGIGGFERIMGPNGQGQYWAPTLEAACQLLLEHYAHGYVVPGERFPRRARTTDPLDRDVRDHPHPPLDGSDFTRVGDVFSAERNPERKKPFDMRSVMHAIRDQDHPPLERWHAWVDAENAIVWDARVGGIPVCMLGIESHPVRRVGLAPVDGPDTWTSGTLFPQASRKIARAINAASGSRPLVVVANLSGFDGSPESMRRWQLEYGAEIGRAVTNFDGPIVFTVVSRYHGGAFVVFSKTLNDHMEIAAVEGSYASVIGGTPAAAVVFAREVRTRTQADPRVVEARRALARATGEEVAARRTALAATTEAVHSEKIGELATEFDGIHTIERARDVGSVDEIIAAEDLRPWVVAALERGMARFT